MKRNNNIDKEIYSAPTLKEALKIAMSETPLEEFEMERKLDNAAYSFGTFSLNGILSSNNKSIANVDADAA